jgi:hypothetical protein
VSCRCCPNTGFELRSSVHGSRSFAIPCVSFIPLVDSVPIQSPSLLVLDGSSLARRIKCARGTAPRRVTGKVTLGLSRTWCERRLSWWCRLNRHHGANGKDSVGGCGTQHVVCAKGRGFWWYVDVRVSSRYRLAGFRKIWFIHARRRSSGFGCAFVQQSRSKRMSALVSRCTSSAAGSPSIVMLGGHHCSEQGSKPQDLLMIANRRLSVAVKRLPRKRAVYPPPSTICLLTLDAMPPPGSPVAFQADGPKSPVVSGTS